MKKILLFNIFVIFFITLFCSLGTWQLYRLQWKQDLISQIDQGLKSTPIKYSNKIINDYQRVVLEGKYDFKNQIYLYSLNERGQPGFDVITPFETNDKDKNYTHFLRNCIQTSNLIDLGEYDVEFRIIHKF